MTLFYLKRAESRDLVPPRQNVEGPRIGFTVSRALGGAVHRNRIRRRMREAVRGNLPLLKAPVDVVINPKKSAELVDFAVLRVEVTRAFAAIQEKTMLAADERGATRI